MRGLDKSQIGLGKVRNQIAPSIDEFSILELKYKQLTESNDIVGSLSTLDTSNDNVSYDVDSDTFTLNMDGVNVAKILVNEDSKTIKLVGGLQGKAMFFEFENLGSNNLYWENLRVENGSNPSLSITTNGGEPSKTVIEVVKLGNFYYMIGIYREEPEYTLPDLVNELNEKFDIENYRISGSDGVVLERFKVTDSGGDTITLGSITLSDNQDYVESGYDFILDIPEELVDLYYPAFMLPIIDQLETDKTKYYINKI
jgi:hypothetical protein